LYLPIHWYEIEQMLRRCAACLLVAAAIQARVASAQTSTEPTPATQITPPRSGPLFLSLGVGADYLYGRWHDDNLNDTRDRQNAGLALHAAIGAVIAARGAVFFDGQVRVPFAPPLSGLSIAAIGVGGTVFLGQSGHWHADAAIRRAWIGGEDSQLLRVPAPVTTFSGSWLAEIGGGYATRRGRWDRGPTLSLLGGQLRADRASGWLLGIEIMYAWSRF
jgi:hypothetical protein